MARHSLRDKKTGRFISKKDYQAQQKHIKTMAKSITNLINAVKNSKKSTKELNKEINDCIKRIVNETPKANSQIRLMDVGVKRLAGSFKMLKKPVKEVFDIFKKMLGMTFSGPTKLYGVAGVGTKLLSSMGLQELKSKAIGTGTTATNLRALNFAEEQLGMQGYVSGIQEKLLTNLYNPSGWGSIATTLGLTNEQAQERYGGDTVEGAFKLIEDMQKHINNVYGVHGRKSTEYEAVIKSFADQLGLSDEAVENLFGANRGGELVSAFNQSKRLKITEGQLRAQQASTASLQRLQVALQNFLTVLSSPMLKLTNNFTKNLNKVTNALGKKENQEAMNEFVGSVNAFVDELTDEGLKVLDWFFQWFKSEGKKSLDEWFNWVVSMIKKLREWLNTEDGKGTITLLWDNITAVAKAIGEFATAVLPVLGETILKFAASLRLGGIDSIKGENGQDRFFRNSKQIEAMLTQLLKDIGRDDLNKWTFGFLSGERTLYGKIEAMNEAIRKEPNEEKRNQLLMVSNALEREISKNEIKLTFNPIINNNITFDENKKVKSQSVGVSNNNGISSATNGGH